MVVKLSDSAVDTFASVGVDTEMIGATIQRDRDMGLSDDEITNRMYAKIKEINPKVLNPQEMAVKYEKTMYPSIVRTNTQQYGLKPLEFSDDTSYEDRYYAEYERAQEEGQRRAEKSKQNMGRLETAMNVVQPVHNFVNSALAGVPDLALAGIDAIADTDTIESRREWRDSHPIQNVATNVAGYIVPAGAMGKAVKASMAVKIGGPKAVQLLGQWGLMAASTEAVAAIHRTAERVAGTDDWNDQMSAVEQTARETGEGLLWNIGLQAAFSGAGAAVKPLIRYYSKTEKAIRAMGGRGNIMKAKQGYDDAIKAGASQAEASNTALARLSEGMDAEALNRMEKLITHDKDFAKFMQDQFASAKQVVTDDVVALTQKEVNKASDEMLTSIWKDPNYKNTLGTSEVDLSRNSIKQKLGTDSKKFLEVREKAIGDAIAKVESNPTIGADVYANFKSLSDDLKNSTRDFTRAAKSVEPTTLKSFEKSGKMQEAMQEAQRRIAKAQEAAAQAKQPFGPADAQKIELATLRESAENHFREIMDKGTDSIQDINDIKTFFTKIDEQAVAAGQAEAFGAFNEGVNTRILDKLDNELFKANQALRAEKPLLKAWDYGYKTNEFNVTELSNFLDDGTSAVQKAAKLAEVKNGFYARYAEAAVKGDVEAINQMQAMLRSQNSMGKFISPESFNEAYKVAIQPKVHAAATMQKMMKATNNVQFSNPMAAEWAKAAMYGVLQAPVAFGTTLFKIMSGTYSGRAVTKRIQTWLQNPNWADFNKVVGMTTDLTERQILNRAVSQAIITQSSEGLAEQ